MMEVKTGWIDPTVFDKRVQIDRLGDKGVGIQVVRCNDIRRRLRRAQHHHRNSSQTTGPYSWLLNRWNREMKSRTLARLRLHPNAASVLFHNLLADGQAESRAGILVA